MKNEIIKVRKKIGFNFYRGELSDKNIWDAEQMFNYFIKKEEGIVFEIKDKTIEIEPKGIEKYNKLYFFQISNLRVDTLPTKKTIGKQRVEIPLDDDEYIGEFTSVLYDATTSVFMIQINRHGIGVEIISEFLKKLRQEYYKSSNKNLTKEIELNLIIDTEKLEKVKNSKEIRKITIKSSINSLTAISKKLKTQKEKNMLLLDTVKKSIEGFGNIEFEIKISAKVREHEVLEKSLSQRWIEEGLKLLNCQKNKENKELLNEKFAMSVVRKENDDTLVENVDFLLPKVVEYISFLTEAKVAIGKEELRVQIFERYNKIKSKIDSLIP